MNPTEQVARWLHTTFVAKAFPKGEGPPWEEVRDKKKEDYRIIAAELLANPPPALVEALKEKTP